MLRKFLVLSRLFTYQIKALKKSFKMIIRELLRFNSSLTISSFLFWTYGENGVLCHFKKIFKKSYPTLKFATLYFLSTLWVQQITIIGDSEVQTCGLTWNDPVH